MERAKVKPDRDFHLYALIGQSNMAGRGAIGPEDTEIHPRVLCLDRSGEWVPAVDPLHFDKPIAGVGPGLTFGKTMAESDPEIRIGLIPCAAGGSPIRTWQPGGYWEQTKSHPYDDALARCRIAQQDGVLKGFLWHQGESNSNEQDAPRYLDQLKELVSRLRTALQAPQAAFVVATLGDFCVTGNAWAATINDALEQLTLEVEHTACVSAAGLIHGGDDLHFDAASARELGRRYAMAMARLHRQGEKV
jgi:hypothetical protein